MMKRTDSVRRILKDRRGVAVEMAVYMMLTVFALCTVLVILCMSLRTRDNRAVMDIQMDAKIDGAGEDFLRAVREDAAAGFVYADERYTTDVTEVSVPTVYAESGIGYRLILSDPDHRVALQVVACKRTDTGAVTVIKWSYTDA